MDPLNQPSQPAWSNLDQGTKPTQAMPPIPQQLYSPIIYPGSRLLHIYAVHKGLFHYDLRITDSDKYTELYAVHANSGSMFSSKPHMRIARASSDRPNGGVYVEIGGVTFHLFSPVEIDVHERRCALQRVGFWRPRRIFQSSSAGTLTWVSQSSWTIRLALYNSRNEVLARVSRPGFSGRKYARVELASPDIQGTFLDEVIVSALAVIQQMIRERSAAAGGGAAAAGGGA